MKMGRARKQALLRPRIYTVVFSLSFSLHISTLFVSALLHSELMSLHAEDKMATSRPRLTLSAEQAQSEDISFSLYLNINQRKDSATAWIILYS